ncbi:hypothetical protein [Streptomyces cyanogenus]|uniref:Uncharacterized protein n=1 Tax=Streptomyces cyanogenus TaxID=80860 RepID=A0ABX7TUV1_STRCY|nr:hypothetical protein [Streptomyces cyanogenus]QTE00535.1 hypothetical protein S1361_24605 [Streptomyces cyanogenus]
MTPIPGRSAAAQDSAPASTPGARRGRHRKPHPRKVLLAVVGLLLAAGALSLVRVAPESGVGASGTAEAEPRRDPGGRTPDGPANTSATIAAPTALPSATSAMGGRSLAPAPAGSPVPTAPGTAPGTATAAPGPTAVPTAEATRTPGPPGGPTGPAPTASAPRPAPATPTPSPTPTPGHGPAEPDPGGVCVPVIALCVDVLGDDGGRRAATAGRRGA